MRTMFALVFFVLAAWRGYIDWQATMAQGEDLAMANAGTVWLGLSPGTLESISVWAQGLETPLLWDPALVTFLSAPLAPMLLVLAIFFFVIRRKAEPMRHGEMA